MTIATPAFEERLLPTLLEALSERSRAAERQVGSRRQGRRLVAVVVAATAALIAVALGISATTEDSPITVVVTSGSMSPTLKVGQEVAVDVNAYRSVVPSRGDIIAFRVSGYPDLIFIKRVIGLPGETVDQSGGVVYVDGRALDEPYAVEDSKTLGPWIVEPSHLFVMGDDRPNSNDSRYTMGQIPFEDIVGRVLLGQAPIDRPSPPGQAPTASTGN